jgi:hypothetical protein
MTQLLYRVRIHHSFGQKHDPIANSCPNTALIRTENPQQANSSPNTVIAVGLFHNSSAEIQGLYPKTTIYAKTAKNK